MQCLSNKPCHPIKSTAMPWQPPTASWHNDIDDLHGPLPCSREKCVFISQLSSLLHSVFVFPAVSRGRNVEEWPAWTTQTSRCETGLMMLCVFRSSDGEIVFLGRARLCNFQHEILRVRVRARTWRAALIVSLITLTL